MASGLSCSLGAKAGVGSLKRRGPRPYPQGPMPVSSCLLHTGTCDVAQATAEKTDTRHSEQLG